MKCKNTAGASSNKQFPGDLFKEPSEQNKMKIQRKKLYSVVQEQMRVRCLRQREQTGGGACCERPRQRGTDASRTWHDSSVLSQRATSAAPAQRKNCCYSSISSRWDHETTKYRTYVFRRPPDRGGILKSSFKKAKINNHFFIRAKRVSNWYTPEKKSARLHGKRNLYGKKSLYGNKRLLCVRLILVLVSKKKSVRQWKSARQ